MSDMNGKIKAVFNWSGGKDSSLALLKALRSGLYDITALLTTVNSAKERSSMHDIPLSLLEKQASSIGIPLYKVPLVPHGDMRDYENAMRQAVLHFRKKDVTHFIFGDIFLHDVMSYRRSQLEPYGITVVEPLWDTGTEEIMDEFLASGLKTVIVTTDASVLGSEYAGREITRNLVDSFPQGCDPCRGKRRISYVLLRRAFVFEACAVFSARGALHAYIPRKTGRRFGKRLFVLVCRALRPGNGKRGIKNSIGIGK